MKLMSYVCLTVYSCSLAAAWMTTSVIPRHSITHNGHTHRISTSRQLSATATPPDVDYTGKTLYQRVFYRFSPASDVDVHDAIVVEERVHFVADPERTGYLKPVGHRTVILRDGNVEDGEIGDDFFTLTIDPNTDSESTTTTTTTTTHTGAGTNAELESQIVTAMYLASNPSLCTGTVLQIACGSGVAGLLGCIGAGFTARRLAGEEETGKPDVAEEILTIAKDRDGVVPNELKMLTLTDVDEDRLNEAFHNCKHSGVAPSKVEVEPLDWTNRALRPKGGPRVKEYKTIVASDVAFTYPETKALARAVANRLEPSAWYLAAPASDTTIKGGVPRFVHTCPDARDDVAYLRRILEKGYRMSVASLYLKVEKLQFVVQALPESEPESALDDEELELMDFRDLPYQALVAQHHPDYAGEGSGELFFPMETGEYEVRSGSTYLEPDAGGSSW